MKELSIEEKAKRYDEAIEIAKDCQYDSLALSQPVKDVIEHIFPELKEDERIKSCIKKCLSNAGEQVFDNYHIRLNDCLDWLEKQKETTSDEASSNKNTSTKNKKKYILTDETIEYRGHRLYRIKAIKSFSGVRKGSLGGWVESERNLLHEGDCWIFDDAKVFESAEVALNAQVHNNACIYGKAVIAGGYIYDNVEIYDCAKIGGILDYVLISGNAKIHDNAKIFHRAEVHDNAEVYENAIIKNCARVFDKAKIHGDVVVSGNADITKNAEVIRNNDYSVYRDTWSNTCWYNSYITWTRSNGKWTVGTFYGSDKELIREAYKDSKKSGKRYEVIVDVNKLLLTN